MKASAATITGAGGDIDDANHVADASAALKSRDNFYRAILDAAISYIRRRETASTSGERFSTAASRSQAKQRRGII
jgi:hypothetical protein